MTAADELPAYLQRLVDAADDLPLRHRMPQADGAARRSAVLILFGEGPAGPDLLLIEKSAHLRSHAGSRRSPAAASTRLTTTRSGRRCARPRRRPASTRPASRAGHAAELFLPPSDRLVVPVLAWWDDPRDVSVGDPREVARVARVPLADLADPAHRFRVRHPVRLRRTGVRRRRHGGLGLHRRPARRDPRGHRPGPAVGRHRRPAAPADRRPRRALPGSGDDEDADDSAAPTVADPAPDGPPTRTVPPR